MSKKNNFGICCQTWNFSGKSQKFHLRSLEISLSISRSISIIQIHCQTPERNIHSNEQVLGLLSDWNFQKQCETGTIVPDVYSLNGSSLWSPKCDRNDKV